jgi:hypothetical protein
MKGTKASGLAYERKVHKHLLRQQELEQLPGELFAAQWLVFKDMNGIGYAQPDFFLILDDMVVLFEAKLTQRADIAEQMLGLYLPLLTKIYNRPICCIQVFKNLINSEPGKMLKHPVELIKEPRKGIFHWHLLG